eukprot:5948066-Pyramimonas_sp.AAC.1
MPNLITNREAFYPPDWETNDGYCPWLSRKNPKLGHLANCSVAQRRPPKTTELQSEMAIVNVSQRRDETLRDSPGEAVRLHFKQELLAMLPRTDSAPRYKSCAVVSQVVRCCALTLTLTLVISHAAPHRLRAALQDQPIYNQIKCSKVK